MQEIRVYDKAKYHYEGDFPPELNRYQAYVHIGMYLGWAGDALLLSEMMLKDFAPEVQRFKNRDITGADMLRLCGGSLASDMLNSVGNEFTQFYYDDLYIGDYSALFCPEGQSLYRVPDTLENFTLIANRINGRFQQWSSCR